MELQRDFFIGIVEDNIDPDRNGRIKVRVQTLYQNIPLEDIPYAYPLGSLAGKEFQIPAIGKLVNVLYLSDDLYSPYYIYSENYNINLQNKLKSLSDDEYARFNALLFDDRTQIFSDSNELTLDHYFNKMTISKWGINLELKDNKQILNLGSKGADQEAVLGTRFFEWMDDFISALRDPMTLVDSNMTPIIRHKLDSLCDNYKALRKDFVSKHVKIVDNRAVDSLDRSTDPSQHDTDLVIPDASAELLSMIEQQTAESCGQITESAPSGVDSIPNDEDIPEVSSKQAVFMVKRYKFMQDRTLGKLYINNVYFCDTLEDKVRNIGKEKKVNGETAIPFGTYKLTIGPTGLKRSVAPTGRAPLVNNVPYFSGIRIHLGSKPLHTRGCLLVGKLNKITNTLTNSRQVADKITMICEDYQRRGVLMDIVYTKDENAINDTSTPSTNSYNGSNYTTNSDTYSDSDCVRGPVDSSWITNLEMDDIKLDGQEIKFDGNYLVTIEQLKFIMPQASKSNIEKFIVPINVTLKKYGITSPLQIAAFLSQIAIESGYLKYTCELGGNSYFLKYNGRKDLGNTQPGDGPKYKGRGLIQTTGRVNYTALSKKTGVDFVENPQLLETSMWAAISAGVWWFDNQNKKTKRGRLKDCIANKNIEGITRAVNGGTNHIEDRTKAYNRALKAFNLS